jgi:diadenosine tetraphosphate (Ap4A) HIT family hydrolase
MAVATIADDAMPAAGASRVLWGIGDELAPARQNPLYRSGAARMVTAWYNGPSDLDWMRQTEAASAAKAYAAGDAVELVVWLADHTEYAVGDQFQKDVRTLTRLHKPKSAGHLYIVLFTEFETYRDGDAAYRARLMDAYKKAVAAIHREYAQANVALGFGGYAWDGTHERDLRAYKDEIAISDFTAVQQMQACDSTERGRNIVVDKVRASVKQLGGYGKPVMISHFKLWGEPGCQVSAFGSFAREMFTSASITDLVRDGLFAWNFMADHYIDDAGPVRDDAVERLKLYKARPQPGPEAPTAGMP